MKKIIQLFIIIIFISSSTLFSQEKFKYSESIEFEIENIKKWNSIATGSGFYKPNKGFKYFMVYINFKNNSNKKHLVNFKDFYLIDLKKKIKYNVDLSLAPGAITWIYTKDSKKISPNQMKTVKLAIICPEEFIPEFLMLEAGGIFPISSELLFKKEKIDNELNIDEDDW